MSALKRFGILVAACAIVGGAADLLNIPNDPGFRVDRRGCGRPPADASKCRRRRAAHNAALRGRCL